MTLNLARDPFIKQTCSFVILGSKRIDRVNVNETYLLDSHWVRSRITSPGYRQLDHVTTPRPRSYVKSYCLFRARNSKNTSPAAVDFLDQTLKESLRFFVLGNACWHLKLSKAFGDPPPTVYGPETCDSMCPVCSKEISEFKLSIKLENFKRAIILIFARKTRVGLVKEMGTLLLKEHKTNQIWTRKPDRYHVDFLVLQLVAADLLETGVVDKSRDRDGDDISADEVFVKIAYERDHDTTRSSVDVDTSNWNELFLVLL
jgi:hypothetical protein